MTEAEFLALPDRDKNALIAKKLFDHKVVVTTWGKQKQYKCYSIGEPDYCYPADSPGGELVNPVPNYVEDIAAAWEVAEKLWLVGLRVVIRNPWHDSNVWMCDFGTEEKGFRGGEATAATHAICLAALKAVGAIE